ncbi:MAG: ATP-binding protein [Pseudomonadota bacterium]|nr:ATP-binding protein [Pseudomonadota bacterium]
MLRNSGRVVVFAASLLAIAIALAVWGMFFARGITDSSAPVVDSDASRLVSAMAELDGNVRQAALWRGMDNWGTTANPAFLEAIELDLERLTHLVDVLRRHLPQDDQSPSIEPLEALVAAYRKQLADIEADPDAYDASRAASETARSVTAARATLLRLKEWRDKVEADNTPRSDVIGTDGVAILGLLLLAALTAIALAGAFWLRREFRTHETTSNALALSDAVFDNSPDAMLWISAGGEVLRANQQASALFGYEPAVLRGTKIEALMPPRFREGHADLRDGYLRRPAPRRMGSGKDLYILNSSGHEVPVDIALSHIDRGPNSVVMVSIRDVADQRKMQEGLKDARIAADRANRSKSAFLANMSHEIRTPLTAVLGMADILDSTELTDDQRHYVSTIRQSGKHLAGLLDDILDLSKLEAGRLVLRSEPVDFDVLLNSIKTMFGPAARAKSVALTVDPFSPPAGMAIQGDMLRLRQIAYNLVGNAVKFTDTGKVAVSFTLTRDADREDNGWLTLSVRDTGIGVPKEKAESIFLPFMQADNDENRRFQGTGLGLAICSRLIDQMGGRITLESEPGQGSHFLVEVPLTLIRDEEKTPKETAARHDKPVVPAERIKGLRILAADDNPVNRMLIVSMLSAKGFAVTIAEDGAEALARFREDHFDVVLLDIHMPVMDGMETLKAIRASDEGRNLPVIALTADVMFGSVVEYQKAGFNDCVAKPIDWNVLVDAIGQVYAMSGRAEGAGVQ